MNEVLSALGGALLSWLAQSASTRISQGRQRQDATTLALAQLTTTVTHLEQALQRHERCMGDLQDYLDKERNRLQAYFDKAKDDLLDHDKRIAILERNEH